MKNGFKETLVKILSRYGMYRSGVLGTVWAVGNCMWKTLTAMGLRIENGVGNTNYDYIILSEKMSDLEHIIVALTRIDNGCIIIFRVDSHNFSPAYNVIPNTRLTVYPYKDNKFLGVLLKGNYNYEI